MSGIENTAPSTGSGSGSPGSNDAASALLAANRRRRSIRRWLVIGTLPLTLAGLLFAGKLLSMYGFAHQAISTYVVGNYSGSTAAAQGQEILNWFEPYKAPYDVGTALAGSEQLDAARGKFEEALPLASGLEVCAVRVNLALVIERQGDAARTAGDGPGAAQFYGEALLITAETPKECNSDEADEQSPDPDRSMSDALEGLADRLQEKQQQSEQPNPDQGDGDEQEKPQQPDQDKLDELQEKLEQGAEERQQNQGDEDGPGGGTDKPW